VECGGGGGGRPWGEESGQLGNLPAATPPPPPRRSGAAVAVGVRACAAGGRGVGRGVALTPVARGGKGGHLGESMRPSSTMEVEAFDSRDKKLPSISAMLSHWSGGSACDWDSDRGLLRKRG
jgi:hypothetical protein